jgi:hypothetical protein
MREIRRLFNAITNYARSDDPLVAATNVIALCVVGNQPFYPLYVWWVVGDDGWTSLLTFLSTPFFVVVPWVARRSSLAGRAMLPIVGIANTIWSAKAFGAPSAVALFLCPCAMIAGMALRAKERNFMLAVIGMAILAFALIQHGLGGALHTFTADEYARFVSLNAWSVAGLTGLVALQYSNAYGRSAD